MVDASTEKLNILDLRRLFIIWLKWSWILLLLAGLGAYRGISDVRNHVPMYVASITVLPEGGSSRLDQVSSQLGSVIGGLRGGQENVTSFDRMKVILGSVDLARRLQTKFSLLQRIYASGWDESKEAWIVPSGEAFERNQRFRAFFNLAGWRPPDVERLANYLRGGIDFDDSTNPGFITISFAHSDPDFAHWLLNIVYQDADDLLRQQERQQSEQVRLSIENRLRETKFVDNRQVLIGLLAREERKLTLIASDLPYAGRIIAPLFVSKIPTQPNLKVAIAFPMVGAVLIGLVLITLLALIRTRD